MHPTAVLTDATSTDSGGVPATGLLVEQWAMSITQPRCVCIQSMIPGYNLNKHRSSLRQSHSPSRRKSPTSSSRSSTLPRMCTPLTTTSHYAIAPLSVATGYLLYKYKYKRDTMHRYLWRQDLYQASHNQPTYRPRKSTIILCPGDAPSSDS